MYSSGHVSCFSIFRVLKAPERNQIVSISQRVLTPYLAWTSKVAHPAVLHDDVISTDFRVCDSR